MSLSKKNFLNFLNQLKNNNDIYSFLIYFLFFIIFLRTLEQLFGKSTYDWDLDHMMYYSGRLLKGELIYVNEFDDKLPIIQYLFLIPAYFKNVNLWSLFSILITFFTSFKIFVFLKAISINEWQIKNFQFINKAAFLTSLFYVFFISSLNGSFSHINGFATSFSILALISYTDNFKSKLDQNTRIKNLISSSIFAAISISIRPYFAPGILLVVVWNNLRIRNLTSPSKNRKISFHLLSILKESIIYLLFISISGLILNITPYIIQGNIKSFFNGIFLNLSPLHPTYFWQIIKEKSEVLFIEIGNFESLIYLPFFIISVFFIIQYFFNKKNNYPKKIIIDLIFLSILSPLSILIVILNKHFWAHYIQFYSGYAAFSIFSIFIIFKKKFSKIFDFKIKRPINLFLAVTLLIIVGRLELIKSIYKFSVIPRVHNMQNNLEVVERFLDQRNSEDKKIDFLYPEGIYVHWKLDEPRYGFPHSAHFQYIENGYWNKIKLGIKENEDYSKKGFCKMIIENSPSLVFTERDSYIFKCLNSANNKKIEKVALKKKLYVFIKD